jgi:hypothetical protein
MKSLLVLSAPFPIADPGGRGAGDNPQLALLALSASTQYSSPLARLRPILSAAVLNNLDTFLNASSLPPMVSCALKVWTETMGEGFATVVADSNMESGAPCACPA